MRLGISSSVLVVALVVVAVVGAPEAEHHVEKRQQDLARTVTTQLRTVATIAQGIATLLKLTSSVFPLATVFTAVFGFIAQLLGKDKKQWEMIQNRMREIAKEEVANYHDLLAQGFIKGIQRSAELFSNFPSTHNGKPNEQKISEGVVLSGVINNNKQWVNTELGKNPQRMILYFMEVASIDVAVLYNMAALYGKQNPSHWTRVVTRVGHHASDAEKAARKVIEWRTGSKFLSCQRTECKTGTRRCGPKGKSTCDVKSACMKGIDQGTEVCGTQYFTSRCGATACRKSRRVCNKYSKTKVGASNCDFFKNEIKSKTQAWLNKHVMDAVNQWRNLVRRKH